MNKSTDIKKEFMRNKLAVICIYFCLLSYINSNNQQDQDNITASSDSVVEKTVNNQAPEIQFDTIKKETHEIQNGKQE